MALRNVLEAHFEHSGPKGTRETAWWRAGYERNYRMSPRAAKKRRNLREKLWNEPKSVVNYERNSLRPKGTQEMLANLTKVMIYKGKLHTAPHLSREIRKSQKCKIPS